MPVVQGFVVLHADVLAQRPNILCMSFHQVDGQPLDSISELRHQVVDVLDLLAKWGSCPRPSEYNQRLATLLARVEVLLEGNRFRFEGKQLRVYSLISWPER